MNQGINILLLSLFSGFNIGFAILTSFVWFKNKDQKVYLSFAIFSFFSGFYFILKALTISYEKKVIFYWYFSNWL